MLTLKHLPLTTFMHWQSRPRALHSACWQATTTGALRAIPHSHTAIRSLHEKHKPIGQPHVLNEEDR